MATIRHPTPLALGQFHTVTLLRSLTQGSLIVGSLAPVNGTSQVRPSPVPLGLAPLPPPPSPAATPHVPSAQGKFQGLDLNEELYLGGYPDYGAIPKAGLSSGFIGEPPCPPPAALVRPPPGLAEPVVTQEDVVTWASGHPHLGSSCPPAPPPGCVRELRIQGEEIVFHDLNLTAHGISHCPTCRDRPCQVTLEAAPSSRLPLATALGRDGTPLLNPVGSRGRPGCPWPDLWGLPRRTGASARTRRAAATCVCAQLASPGAAVSTHRPCTATQVGTHPPRSWLPRQPIPSACHCASIPTLNHPLPPQRLSTHHARGSSPKYLDLPGF